VVVFKSRPLDWFGQVRMVCTLVTDECSFFVDRTNNGLFYVRQTTVMVSNFETTRETKTQYSLYEAGRRVYLWLMARRGHRRRTSEKRNRPRRNLSNDRRATPALTMRIRSSILAVC
jgi:hypothetical protein